MGLPLTDMIYEAILALPYLRGAWSLQMCCWVLSREHWQWMVCGLRLRSKKRQWLNVEIIFRNMSTAVNGESRWWRMRPFVCDDEAPGHEDSESQFQ